MFDVASPELLLVAVVAVVVIGPKDLPKAMRVVGYWVGKARGTMRQFRAGFDAMVREAELAEMEKKWAEENKRILSEHPPSEAEQSALPAPDTSEADVESAPVMTEKPAIHDEPELPLAPAPETRTP
jgi:sec-independent protein translocase protein TatB